MPAPLPRDWVPPGAETRVQMIAGETARMDACAIAARIDGLIAQNREIHERSCFNLNPATKMMNPAAEAALSAGLGTRASLGYPGRNTRPGSRRSKRSR